MGELLGMYPCLKSVQVLSHTHNFYYWILLYTCPIFLKDLHECVQKDTILQVNGLCWVIPEVRSMVEKPRRVEDLDDGRTWNNLLINVCIVIFSTNCISNYTNWNSMYIITTISDPCHMPQTSEARPTVIWYVPLQFRNETVISLRWWRRVNLINSPPHEVGFQQTSFSIHFIWVLEWPTSVS